MYLGDKESLELQIHEITGIAIMALQGSPLPQFTVNERMSWAAKRETTIEEDKAYCLLGIFNIHLPLIYDEGMTNAYIRLREQIDRHSDVKGFSKEIPNVIGAQTSVNSQRHGETEVLGNDFEGTQRIDYGSQGIRPSGTSFLQANGR